MTFGEETGVWFPLGREDAVEEEPCGHEVPGEYGGPAVTTACQPLHHSMWGGGRGSRNALVT